MLNSIMVFIIIILLLFLNAIFVAAEFALVSSPRTSIDRRASQGNTIAALISSILHNPHYLDQYMATFQLGITLASLGLGMYGEHAMAQGLNDWFLLLGISGFLSAGISNIISSIFAVTLLSYLHIVLGEAVPKSMAIQYSEKIALILVPIMRIVKAVFYPFVICLDTVTNGVLKMFGIKRQACSEHCHTSEELEFIVKESQEGGLIRKEAGHVIKELFEFSELTAGEVMVPRVAIHGIPTGVDDNKLLNIIHDKPHTRYPVYEKNLDHITGMVHIKDIMNLLINKISFSKKNIRSVPYIPETLNLDQVLSTMRKERTQLVIVLDEYGGTAGLITIDDLFEEVVGKIEEKPGEHKDIYRDGKGIVHVAGAVRIEEVGEYIGVVLEHSEVDMVSGLVLALLGRPPKVGDKVTYCNVVFEVTRVKGRGVRECIVTKL